MATTSEEASAPSTATYATPPRDAPPGASVTDVYVENCLGNCPKETPSPENKTKIKGKLKEIRNKNSLGK